MSLLREKLDQWISFLKTGDIPESFDAQGLPEARERLRVDNLPEKERREYQRELERRMVENDVMNTYFIDGKDEGVKEGEKNEKMKIARNMKGKDYPIEDIIDMTGLSAEEIAELEQTARRASKHQGSASRCYVSKDGYPLTLSFSHE